MDRAGASQEHAWILGRPMYNERGFTESHTRGTLWKDKKRGEGADLARMGRVQVHAVMSFLEVSQALSLPARALPQSPSPSVKSPGVQHLPLLL